MEEHQGEMEEHQGEMEEHQGEMEEHQGEMEEHQGETTQGNVDVVDGPKVTAVRTHAAAAQNQEGDDDFMAISQKEKAAWIKMIKTRHAAMVRKEQDHKKWKDAMLQRRINVFNTSKKLLSAQRDRFRFLFKMSEVVKHLSENRLNENEEGKDDDIDNKKDFSRNTDNDDVINANNTDDHKNGTIVENSENDEIVQTLGSVPSIVVNEPTR